jgi:hypothetical protein
VPGLQACNSYSTSENDFGSGGLGGDAGIDGGVSLAGSDGYFGGGGGGGAAQCAGLTGCGGMQGAGGAGGFGGGGGAGGSWPGGLAGAGGNGGFGGGAGVNGLGLEAAAVGLPGFGAGAAVANAGGGGGAGFGGAIFIRSGHLDLHHVVFASNVANGGASLHGESGKGKGAALYVLRTLSNANGNDQGLPATLPTVAGCGNSLSANAASDAGNVNADNADVFGADRTGLTLVCGDRIFADTGDAPWDNAK